MCVLEVNHRRPRSKGPVCTGRVSLAHLWRMDVDDAHLTYMMLTRLLNGHATDSTGDRQVETLHPGLWEVSPCTR